jgi:hypothetical protein
VRFSGDRGIFDARFEFPEPVRDHQDMPRVMRALFRAAYEAAVPGHGWTSPEQARTGTGSAGRR